MDVVKVVLGFDKFFVMIYGDLGILNNDGM